LKCRTLHLTTSQSIKNLKGRLSRRTSRKKKTLEGIKEGKKKESFGRKKVKRAKKTKIRIKICRKEARSLKLIQKMRNTSN